jgi:hypothetical protein
MKKMLVCLSTLCMAQVMNAQQYVDISTGVNNSNGSYIGLGNNDDTWIVTAPNGTVYTPIVVSPSFWPNGDCSRWITPNSTTGVSSTGGGAPGNYTYTTTFNNTGCVIPSTNAYFTYISGDNTVTSLILNGNTHTFASPQPSVNLASNITITLPGSEFVQGTNTLSIVVYNNPSSATGLSATGLNICGRLTINHENNSPTFALSSSHTPGNSYFTCFATPTVTTLPPNGGYAWVVEEIVSPTNTTVISGKTASNPNCWWNSSPYTCDFHGYDGSLSTVMDPNCASPTPGHFTTGHTYRVTRGTWSNVCPWQQYSVIVYMAPGKGVTNNPIVVVEDHNAPDYSAYAQTTSIKNEAAAAEALSVYPNPGTGIFTINTNAIQKGSIEVYDMLGSQVQHIELQANTSVYKLDLSNYPKGIYMINMTSENKKYVQKIVVE